MIGRGPGRIAARLLCAAAAAAIASAAGAQAVPPQAPPPSASEPAELDPNAPLAPMPDIGVAWPDLDVRDTTPAPAQQAGPAAASTPNGDIRYAFAVEGLNGLANAADLLTAFKAQSVLEADRKKTANAAQIVRRSRTDADLLT